MKLRKLLAAYKAKYIIQKVRYEQVLLLNRELILAKGTINNQVDKDDAWWYALAIRHNNIYDIGANVGFSSILATLHQPDKRIVLVDPNNIAISIAEENIKRNHLEEGKIFINAFVSNNKGEELMFYTLGSGSAGSMFGSHADSAKAVNSSYSVKTTTLDYIIQETGISPDLVKVDVEAAESYVLQGAKKLAATQTAIFHVEMHAPQEMPMKKNATLVLEWCVENRYVPYYMKEHSRLKSPDQISHRGRCHLLLLPKNTGYPEYLKSISENDQLQELSEK